MRKFLKTLFARKLTAEELQRERAARCETRRVRPIDATVDPVLLKRVKDFIQHTFPVPEEELTPEASLCHDFGLNGDDAEDFLKMFQREFDVDMADLNFEEHFGPELPPFWELFCPLLLLDPYYRKIAFSGRTPLIPVTILDLYDAAATKRWPDLRDRPRE